MFNKGEDKKKTQSESEQAAGIKFVVMPKEFKKVAGKKINPKIFIIVGGALVLLGASVAAVLFFNKKPQTVVENPPVEETQTPPEEVVQSEETVATTTEQSSLLEPIAPPVEEGPVITEPETPSEKLVQGSDSDADGLTDEEEAIFQTDSTKPDTDGDGFLDGNEIFHLYNPAAPPPVTLLESGIVKLYRNASFGYTVYYPTMWMASSTVSSSEVDFVSPDTESIKIFAEDNKDNLSLRDWFMKKYPTADINALQSYSTKQGYQGLQDAERLNTYIKKGEKIFTISYDLGGVSVVWYRALYGVILNSLVIE